MKCCDSKTSGSFAVPGSSGYLEITANQKSAQKLLNAQRGQECLLQFE